MTRPRFRLAALALATLMVATIVPATAAAERPLDGACDATGLVVCAGIDLAANVDCAVTPTGAASCSWTYGWLSSAYSPAALSGAERHVVTVTATVCAGGVCEVESFEVESECSWAAAGSCDDSSGPNPHEASAQLAMGQCFTVRVDLAATIEATAPGALTKLGSITFSNAGEGAGAACLVDDGRGA